MDPALFELYAEGAPNDEVAVIVRLADPVALPAGVRVIAQFGPIVTLRLPRHELKRVRNDRSVRSMKRARLYGPTPAQPDESTLPKANGNPAEMGSCHDNSSEAALEPMSSDQRRPAGKLTNCFLPSLSRAAAPTRPARANHSPPQQWITRRPWPSLREIPRSINRWPSTTMQPRGPTK